jgi:uncharacterized protein (TIGR03437 family)
MLTSHFGPNNLLVTSLGGTSVEINGTAVPIFYATSGQLGIQIPFQLGGQVSGTLEVIVGGQSSSPRTIFFNSVAPGIFTVNQQGTGQAAALHEDNISPITPESPARPNEVIVLYATGLGSLVPGISTGAAATENLTATFPTVTIDGVPAVVEFSGGAPGYVGLNQINVRIPPNTRAGTEIPVVLGIDGGQSNTVTLPVAP